MFKSAKNTFCDTCAQSSLRYEFCDIFLHTVVISRKTVKSTRNTICDACAENSPRHEFCDIFPYICKKPQNGEESLKHDLWYLFIELA